jgi:hypothetical protein
MPEDTHAFGGRFMQINATSAARATGSEAPTHLTPVAAQVDRPALRGAANDVARTEPTRCVDVMALVMKSSAAGS